MREKRPKPMANPLTQSQKSHAASNSSTKSKFGSAASKSGEDHHDFNHLEVPGEPHVIMESSSDFEDSAATSGEDSGARLESDVSDVMNTNVNYVPVAFVIETEIENHDIFRDILTLLFESIRVPEIATQKREDDRKLAFADFLAHIAFLKTVPPPCFDMRYNIEFFTKTLIIDELPFHNIPNKNQIAIKVLFDILDIRSILYCWKALLFDCSLVLISSQNSL